MRIAVLTTVLPVVPSGGGEVVTAGIIDVLEADGHDVTTYGYLRPDAPAGFRPVGRRPIESEHAGRATQAAWMARALATRRGFSEAKYVSRAYARAVRALDCDLALVDHAQVGWLAPSVPFVHVAHNVESALYAEQPGAVFRREARRLAATERRLAERAREVWTLTAADAAAFAALGGAAHVLPFAPTPPPAPPVERVPHRVALLGTWTWGPNRAGLEWFAAEVLPHLGEREVVVAGRGAEPVLAGTRAQAVGVVPDAHAFLASAAAVAVPSTAGAGLQIKTLDAIASGAPVVATPTALRGIDDPPAHVTVTDDPRAFAAALVRPDGTPTDGRAWVAARADRFRAAVSAGARRAAPTGPRA